jgi:hypothetical protein
MHELVETATLTVRRPKSLRGHVSRLTVGPERSTLKQASITNAELLRRDNNSRHRIKIQDADQ